MTGDGAKRDSDGYLWITGRIDDMLNCSGNKNKNMFMLTLSVHGEYNNACLCAEHS